MPSLHKLLLGAGACVVSVSAMAQSTATLTGTVSDPTGAVVPHASVKIRSLATSSERLLTTDSAGIYVAPSLVPGDYEIDVNAAGFSPYKVEKVTLTVDSSVTVNMKLAVSSAGETVQVESNASEIETQTMTVGAVIDQQTVQDLPLNGRHFLDLTVLTPGGVVAPTAGSLTGASRGLGANSFITAGNREDSVNFQINGVNLNDMSQNQITFQPSINTTSEFKIDNSTFSAEYGRSSGSIVNVSTRSGTNRFHGEVFDYFRNEALDARNYFNRAAPFVTGVPSEKAPLKRNNFGASVGGPLWRDHTFFFASYEGLRQHQGILQNSGVLTAAQRAATVAGGAPAANALLALIPIANDPTGSRFVGFTAGPVQIDQYTGDVLHKIGSQDQVHGFYAFQSDVRTEPALQGDTVPGFGDHRNAHRQVLTVNETHIFTPSLVNEARLGFNRISIAFNPNLLVNPTAYHIGDGATSSIGLPQATLSDIGLTIGGPSGFPQGRNDTLGVFSDTATWLKGKHSFKFGGEFRRFLEASFSGDTGTITYASTANNFEKDTATGFSITPGIIDSRVYINALGAFAQDNFKLTPRLTIEYGVRFEWNGTPVEGKNRFVVFDPVAVTLTQVGTNGVSSPYNQNYNYEPRAGFAWDLRGDSTTVLRGGYAVMADQPVETVVSGLTTNPPFTNKVSYTASTATPTIPVANLYNSAAAAGLSVSSVNPRFSNAYIESYNLNLQQALPAKTVFSLGYYGSTGRHLRIGTNENQPVTTTGYTQVRPYLKLSMNSPIDPGKSINSNILESNSIGFSRYNALWAVVGKDFGHGIEFNANYEWSKSMDFNSLGSQGGLNLQDSNNPQGNYGLSDFDTRNHFAGTAIYALPFKANRLVSGYRLSTIIQYQTGNPVNIVASSDTFNGVAGVVRPNLVAPVQTSKIQVAGATNVSFIQSKVCPIGPTLAVPAGCSFQVQAINTGSGNIYTGVGNIQRNGVTGPGFADVDLSGEKETKLFEGLNFNLRVDAFDILNHPNFGQPSGNVQGTTFGQISSTRFATSDGGSSRQLQISGKFIF